MPGDVVRFPGASGVTLVGRLEQPGVARAWALFAHCFTCSKDLKAVRAISRALVFRGLGVLRFDFSGLGESEGDFADTNFSSNIEDLVAAARYMTSQGQAPTLLIGHSLGGAAVIAAAQQVASARAIATIGAPCDPKHVAHLLDPVKDQIAREGEALVQIGGRPFRVRQQLLDDLNEQTQTERIQSLGKALLILHSPQDKIVGIDNARHLYQHARHPKSFLSLDGADHLLSRTADARYAGGVIASWVERYLPPPSQVPPPHDTTVAQMAEAEGYAVVITAQGHPLRADEPRSVGGSDSGPSPYGLLAAALGACTTMTLRMYAKRKGWPLRDARITLRHQKIHAQDCEECTSKDGRVDIIDRNIELFGDLDEEQRARLLQIADMCPVHRSLHGEVQVRSRLVP